MKIIAFNRRATIRTQTGVAQGSITINPGERVLLDDVISMQLLANSAGSLESVTDFMPFYLDHTRRPKSLTGKRVLFYRNRGLGDQLIATCLSHYFNEVVGAKCFQLCDQVHEPIWYCNPNTQELPTRIPIGIDSLVRFNGKPFYDWFFPIESASEWDCEPEQSNIYDRLFSMVGVDPAYVQKKYKVPVWSMQKFDLTALDTWMQKVEEDWRVNLRKGYVVYQLRAENKGRTVPLHVNDLILGRLNELGLPALCIDTAALTPEVEEMVRKYPNVHNAAQKVSSKDQYGNDVPNVRLYASLVAGAALVVGPDSSAIHLAAASSTPCLSIWGPFSPQSRVKYYPNHLAIWHPGMCDNAPCYNYMEALPAHKCPNGKEQKWCECYEGVTAAEVDDKVSQLLKLKLP